MRSTGSVRSLSHAPESVMMPLIIPPHDGIHSMMENVMPFRLGIFLGLGDAQKITRSGDDDKEIIAQDDEPRRGISRKSSAAGSLHYIERRTKQHVAAEG